MKEDAIKIKSFDFAVRVIRLYKILISERKEYVMSKQLLRSGTSVGANVREARNAESKADFIHKLAIAQKECDESRYWLELLHKTEYINKIEFESLHNDATEVLKLIKSIIVTTKRNLKIKS